MSREPLWEQIQAALDERRPLAGESWLADALPDAAERRALVAADETIRSLAQHPPAAQAPVDLADRVLAELSPLANPPAPGVARSWHYPASLFAAAAAILIAVGIVWQALAPRAGDPIGGPAIAGTPLTMPRAPGSHPVGPAAPGAAGPAVQIARQDPTAVPLGTASPVATGSPTGIASPNSIASPNGADPASLDDLVRQAGDRYLALAKETGDSLAEVAWLLPNLGGSPTEGAGPEGESADLLESVRQGLEPIPGRVGNAWDYILGTSPSDDRTS